MVRERGGGRYRPIRRLKLGFDRGDSDLGCFLSRGVQGIRWCSAPICHCQPQSCCPTHTTRRRRRLSRRKSRKIFHRIRRGKRKSPLRHFPPSWVAKYSSRLHERGVRERMMRVLQYVWVRPLDQDRPSVRQHARGVITEGTVTVCSARVVIERWT